MRFCTRKHEIPHLQETRYCAIFDERNPTDICCRRSFMDDWNTSVLLTVVENWRKHIAEPNNDR
jgi:hypothetical protein